MRCTAAFQVTDDRSMHQKRKEEKNGKCVNDHKSRLLRYSAHLFLSKETATSSHREKKKDMWKASKEFRFLTVILCIGYCSHSVLTRAAAPDGERKNIYKRLMQWCCGHNAWKEDGEARLLFIL